jgi:hypothetical protein
MIRAVINNALIRPLEPLPAEWNDGREIVVEDAESSIFEDLDTWFRELQDLGTAEYDSGEWERVQEVLREADEQAKAQVRREMGSSTHR